MKLLFCRKCRSTFGFISEKTLSCSCGTCYGKYMDNDNVVWSEAEDGSGIPFAIDNHSFFARVDKQGTGKQVNEIYDEWYGKGKIQAWLFKNEDSPGFDTIRKVYPQEYVEITHPVRTRLEKQEKALNETIRRFSRTCG